MTYNAVLVLEQELVEQSNLADGNVDADVVTAEGHVLLQLQGLMEVRHLTQRGQERLQERGEGRGEGGRKEGERRGKGREDSTDNVIMYTYLQ